MNAVPPEEDTSRQKIVSVRTNQMPPRLQILRNVAVFQVKLAADGIRDLILSPLSIIAGIIGLALGGHQAHLPFQHILKFGRRTERWIDLFGVHAAANEGKTESNLDSIAEKVEDLIRQDYDRGGISAMTRARIDEILKNFDGQRKANPSSRRRRP